MVRVSLGFRGKLLLAASALALGAAPAAAQPAAAGAADQVEPLVVTGSRFGPRVVTASPTPVDSIATPELTRTGANDLQGMLRVVAPSFSTPRPSAAGALDFLTPPTLRGLSTGQLLLLVNGKRRHTNAALNNGVQIGRGDVSYDFNAVPAAALSRIEVLRQGASAQYGSDAIAGVLNLQLDNRIGFDASARYGETSKGDGADTQFSIANGFRLGDDGFLRVTGFYQDHNHTNRAQPDTRQQYFGLANGALRPSRAITARGPA